MHLFVNFFCKMKLLQLVNPHIPHQKKEMVPHTPAIKYHLKSEISIILRCQLWSTRYTALRIKNCLKSTSAIKVATMKNTDDFRKGSHHMLLQNRHFLLSAKDERDTKEDTGKSMKNALYVLRCAKRHISG